MLPGAHLPFNLLLTDHTSNGSLWDPVLNAFWYTYDETTTEFKGAENMGLEDNPVGAMRFKGRWGDQQYSDGDERQYSFWGWRRFVDGPTGPWDKGLVRHMICADGEQTGCLVKQDLRESEEDEAGIKIG